ncbi:S8 family serine peptidase [Streptomyces sp. NPDC051776]|uniref:S8 family serine peptidase n=1 Tax=Streptomyces sp. NPDC051776 TaxID=3155414 RepID=UPI0034442DB8
MTAGMGQAHKRSEQKTRRGLLCTLAMVGAWTIGAAGIAPAAVAADVQSKQWYLDAMHVEDMWKFATGNGIKVAVVDGGVNPSTPSLKGQVSPGVDAAGISGDETDDRDGHGTTMAELIAGTGKGGGLRGLAPGAKIIPIRTLTAEMQKKEAPDRLHTVDKAIRAAADSDAKVINLSLGQDGWDDDTKAAVKYAANKGKLMFASVGNEAEELNYVDYPAAYPDVVGVAAADSDGNVGKFSEHGNDVDLAAPGLSIPSWCDESFQKYCDAQGTSQASAIASASAALVWSAHPDWTANQVLRALFDTAGRDWKDGTRSNYLGHGLIRPREIIVNGKGKPGDPNISPLTNEKTSGSSSSTDPSASTSSQGSKDKVSDDTVAASPSEKTDDNGQLGVILGGAAAAVVLAVMAFAVVRKRRSA